VPQTESRTAKQRVDPLQLCRTMYPADPVTPLLIQYQRLDPAEQIDFVERAASALADTVGTTVGWAGDLVTGVLSDLLTNLGPSNASDELFNSSIMLRFDRHGYIAATALVAAATDTPWVAPGGVIPIRQLTTSSLFTFSPRKIASGFVLTREGVTGSNAETVVRLALNESVGVKIDNALFASTPADAKSCAGLLNGLTTLGASSGTSHDALRLDIGKLISAVAPVGGTQLVFIGANDAAAKMLADVGPQFPYPVLAAGALASNTLMCVATNALVVAVDPMPRIDIGDAAVVVMDDTSPADVVSGGSAAASTVKSLWQTDSIGIRVIMNLAWALRHPSGAAFISSVTW